MPAWFQECLEIFGFQLIQKSRSNSQDFRFNLLGFINLELTIVELKLSKNSSRRGKPQLFLFSLFHLYAQETCRSYSSCGASLLSDSPFKKRIVSSVDSISIFSLVNLVSFFLSLLSFGILQNINI